ncbi:flagellar biosynthesis anti-sigma factor FlgM [Dictyobacter kobayashii]|uniref:Uncharacterized protein n=1 Tax=Dictyobacter kobayashii TaxID=2014872 RepID=A0A402ALG6_9CHLR|nr:flagellar biosynthesis anti-sigma factor FlgM [Dictyobacter kobayashii]GCE19889.1 hypothetical protein KDK_36890 [Dictyobacter kobayashii]
MNVQRKQSHVVEHIAQTDPCYKTTYPQLKNTAPEQEVNIAYLKALVLARTDGEARTILVEQLKAQVEAETYSLDNHLLARRLLASPVAPAIVNLGTNDPFAVQEEN